MGAELGVTTSVFASDEQTRIFLAAQKRESDFTPLAADADAEYAGIIELDLSGIEPLVAQPHNPDNIARVSEIKGLKVDQVAIGSCTNSSYQDLMTAAGMLEGRTINRNVSFVVAPGSKQVLRMLADSKALSALLAAGARIAESACGFCIGNSQAPGTDAVSIRTSNRNFLGRSGTKSARIYLTGVETAVASAIKGELTDPRTLGLSFQKVELPEHFAIDDSMIIPPEDKKPHISIFRGPNIGEPPENAPLPEEIEVYKEHNMEIGASDTIVFDHFTQTYE